MKARDLPAGRGGGHGAGIPRWMALLVGLFGILASGCNVTPDAYTTEKFQAAQQAFDSAKSPEDFLRCAGLYQEILDQGMISGAVLYNQGNAFMRGGQRGRAIACYRLAQRYRPLDKDLQHNLTYALGDLGAGEDASITAVLLFWQDWISYQGKFRLLGAMAGVAFALGTAALYARTGRRLLAVCGWTALAVTLLLAISAAYDWRRFDGVQHGVIVRDNVTARQGNGESYEPAFNQPLAEGIEFQVIETRQDWLRIRLSGEKEGWIQRADAVVY